MDIDKGPSWAKSCAEHGLKHESLSLSLNKGKKKENTAVDTHFYFTLYVQFLARDPGVDTSRMGESIPAHNELMI